MVRFGCYESRGDAQDALEDLGLDGEAVKSSSAGVMVTRTRTTEVLFEFQNGWDLSLGSRATNTRAVLSMSAPAVAICESSTWWTWRIT